jgi:hypothetical protein
LGKRIRDPASNYDDYADHEHGRTNDHYFLFYPVVKALRLSRLIY